MKTGILVAAALIAGLLVVAWPLDFIHLPGQGSQVQPYADAVEKVKADLDGNVSDAKIADDIATAKVQGVKLQGTFASGKSSVSHLLRAFGYYESASWELKDLRREETAPYTGPESAKLRQEGADRNRKALDEFKKAADAEMKLARKDLRAGR